MVCAFNLHIAEAEAERHREAERQKDTCVRSQPDQHCEFQTRPARASQLRSCLGKRRLCGAINNWPLLSCAAIFLPKEEIKCLGWCRSQFPIHHSLVTRLSWFGLLIFKIENICFVFITHMVKGSTRWLKHEHIKVPCMCLHQYSFVCTRSC